MNKTAPTLSQPQLGSRFTPVFEVDLARLKQQWGKPQNKAGDSYYHSLRKKLDELATGSQGNRWYLPHLILADLVEGSPPALKQAKQRFTREWSQGEELDRRVHYWNSLQFRTGDRWICAAMLAQLLILFDWLAAEGLWSEAEIDAASTEALDVAEAYLEPHLKGRGHMPFLPDPINQTAACICGLLYVGFMFGKKWRHEARAQRMYAFARNLLPDCIGQFPANGYDTDGFTYMRHIHPQVHTLSVALLEEVEGGDWYHRKFAPHGVSLADINAMQLDFVMPSGYAWPLGRYGYIKSWNLFCQSFAARRTGDPRYLQVCKRDNDAYTYQSPWLGMDLPLGLLWYPSELDEKIATGVVSTKQKRRVIEDSWAVFTNDADRMLSVMIWMEGKAPHFFLEAHGSPLILAGSESWTNSNGVQCDPDQWGLKSWLCPAGQLQKYCDIPGLQAAYVETTATYPKEVGVQHATRTFVNCAAGVVISDRFLSTSKAPVIWQAAVSTASSVQGSTAIVRGIIDVTMRAITAKGNWKLRATPERKPRFEVIDPLEMGMLELESPSGLGDFDMLLDWRKQTAPTTLRRIGEDLLSIDSHESTQILLPDKNSPRAIGTFQTDAKLALLQADGRLCAAGVRTVTEGSRECLWASLPVDVTMDADAVWISGLKYGEFATLRSAKHFVCIRIGNGIEVWGRSPKPLRVHLRHSAVAGQLNGRPVELVVENGWTVIDIPDTAHLAATAASNLEVAIETGSTPQLIRALHEVQQAMAWECGDDVRNLMKWDASREPTLANMELKTEATYVRLEAAATAMALGDRLAIGPLIDLLLDEARRNYSDPVMSAGNAKWWGFPTRNVAIEALMVLHATKALDVFDEVIRFEVWPHGIDAVRRAREVLA